MRITQKKFWLVLILCAMYLFSSINQSYPVSGKTFEKTWVGNVQSVSSVTVENLNTSQVIYSKSYAEKITITNLPHETLLRINWTDWRGKQTETVKVLCEDLVHRLCNTIPFPPKLTV